MKYNLLFVIEIFFMSKGDKCKGLLLGLVLVGCCNIVKRFIECSWLIVMLIFVSRLLNSSKTMRHVVKLFIA